MTKKEWMIKREMYQFFLEEGYKTYAEIFKKFDLHLTRNPQVIAYMVPDKGEIFVNEQITHAPTLSLLIRHEILHEYLDHQMRIMKHKPDGYYSPIDNVAMDYEISNLGYTDEDKYRAQHIKMNGAELSGLVTEVEHPEWVNLSMEEMYDELEKVMDKDPTDGPTGPYGPDDDDQEGDPGEPGGDGTGGGGKGQGKDQKGDDGDSDDEGTDGTKGPGGMTFNRPGGKGKQGGNGNPGEPGEDGDGDDDGDGGEPGEPGGTKGNGGRGGKVPVNGDYLDSLDPNNLPEDWIEQALNIADTIDENGKSKIKPGDRGDARIQELENIKRAAEAQDWDKLEREAQKLQNEVEQGMNKALKDDEDIASELDTERRIKQIEDMLRDPNVMAGIESDIINKKAAEVNAKRLAQQAKRAAAINKQGPTASEFVLDLKKFLANEFDDERDSDWSKYNGKYDNEDNILRPGVREVQRKNKASFLIFFDQSGSWDSSDVEKGMSLLGTLREYEKKGKITTKVLFFADHVHETAEPARYENGTAAGAEVMETIRKLRPDNVIIMTDHDFDRYRNITSDVMIRGGAWMLFRHGSISRDLVSHLRGKKHTRYFSI